jgi:ADP-ribose pyrophosphatase YjhB (NUDIX family)
VTPGEGAAAAVLDGHGRLLLVKENYDRGRYTLPGGAVEDGESALDAVRRETREEAGMQVEIDHLVGVYRLVEGLTVLLFRCVVADGEPQRPESSEIAEVDWFAPGDIPEPRSNLLHHALDDIVAGRRGVVRDGLPRVN